MILPNNIEHYIYQCVFQYYGHRAKLSLIGREDETEELNRRALRLAKEVAVRHGKLMAGNLSNTNIYTPNDERLQNKVREIFKVSHQ